ncbi:hypothetical protein [Arthrobacter sp. U41]|uniref:hypothetical protein n=1 Tax=Arthrobacter sp. U41 TaxID=1849032 RepID=UPI0008596C86|nr:hypothetical protein [Arthrobacter sp. U41]AOT05986.1 hypothetical protein ASPU41_21385 [Arthrobacter sp. U41]
MNELLSGPVIAAGVSVIGLLISVVLVHRLTLLREDRADQRAVQREAASALTEALQDIRRVVERSAIEPVQPRDISEAVSSWETAYRKYVTRLPSAGRHARRSVAAALGEHFGAVGWSNLFPEDADFEVSRHDPIWWENADSYLSYLISRFSVWYDNPRAANKRPILNFDAWLARRQAN